MVCLEGSEGWNDVGYYLYVAHTTGHCCTLVGASLID